MADNPTLTNKKTSFDADTNADIPVRATDRAGFQTQHLRVDVGDAAESLLKVGQQAMTASVPVVLASDQTVIPVSDNSGSLTVDGTVAVSAVGGTVAISAASLPLPTGAATAALQLPDGHNVTVDNAAGAAAVNIQDGGNSITIDAASLPLPTGAATLAEQQTQTTALQLIDNLVLAEDDAHSTGTAGVLALTRRADTASTSAGTDGDYATLNTNGDGRLHVADTRTGTSAQEVQGAHTNGTVLTGKIFPTGFVEFFSGNTIVPHCIASGGVNYNLSLNPDLGLGFIDYSSVGEVYALCAATANSVATARYIAVDSNGYVKTVNQTDNGKTYTRVKVEQGAAGTTVLAAASASNKHKLVGASLTLSVAGSLKFTDGVGDLSGAMDIAATGGFVLPTSNISYIETSTTNTALNIVTTGGAAKGFVVILTEP